MASHLHMQVLRTNYRQRLKCGRGTQTDDASPKGYTNRLASRIIMSRAHSLRRATERPTHYRSGSMCQPCDEIDAKVGSHATSVNPSSQKPWDSRKGTVYKHGTVYMGRFTSIRDILLEIQFLHAVLDNFSTYAFIYTRSASAIKRTQQPPTLTPLQALHTCTSDAKVSVRIVVESLFLRETGTKRAFWRIACGSTVFAANREERHKSFKTPRYHASKADFAA
ncbi:uncharacterized protein EV422DRAFT_542350 [Fimicolochytrium jonesii]|uniref:uncharacterized protein n=1 Tax=Fimicolochytrium jonesii TaxID=1396493 RepID=UPI0022FE9641|nr:uncharacterized protein EV422DRAFT_542350 [Fimicolochytrium jonesii]KAI8817307.1 hypothetical protein EV422DRAFT_542350 [Fimicolochytrium jonesii]